MIISELDEVRIACFHALCVHSHGSPKQMAEKSTELAKAFLAETARLDAEDATPEVSIDDVSEGANEDEDHDHDTEPPPKDLGDPGAAG